MSNYRRLISYIYEYEGKNKGRNVGFAKLETRGGQCRISVNVKKIFTGGDAGVYLLSSGGEVSLGKMFVRGGSGEFRTSVQAESVDGKGCDMESCYGLTIHEPGDDWRTYRTIWEDQVAHAAEIELAKAAPEPEPVMERAGKVIAELEQELACQEGAQRKVPELGTKTRAAAEPKKTGIPAVDEEPNDRLGEEGERKAAMDPVLKSEEAREIREETESVRGTGTELGNGEPAAAETLSQENAAAEPAEAAAETAKAESEAVESGSVTEGSEGQQVEAAGVRPDPPPRRPPFLIPGLGLSRPPMAPPPARPPMAPPPARPPVAPPPARPPQNTGGPGQPGRPDQNPGQPGMGPGQAGPRPGQPGAGPGQPGVNPGQPGMNPGQPGTRPGQSGINPLQPRAASSGMTSSGPGPRPDVGQDQPDPSRNGGSGAPFPFRPIIQEKREELPKAGVPGELEMLTLEEEPEEDPARVWNRFEKTYPKIQAFDSEHGCVILVIKPQDIGLLPREVWVYGNNSFLLHGYYNYRYLIVARLENPKGRPRYLLGVPGHYYSNEKYMASMFGFPHFVLSKKQPSGDGRFGYWYTDIQLGSGWEEEPERRSDGTGSVSGSGTGTSGVSGSGEESASAKTAGSADPSSGTAGFSAAPSANGMGVTAAAQPVDPPILGAPVLVPPETPIPGSEESAVGQAERSSAMP